MEDTPVAPPPASAPTPRKGLVIGVALLILVAVLAGAGYFYTNTIVGAYRETAARFALVGTRVIEGPLEARTVYTYGITGRTETHIAVPGKLVDYVRSGKSEAALVVNETTRDMAVVIPGSAPRTFASGPTIKSSLAVSPDGKTIAYAELIKPAQGATVANYAQFYDPTRWVVKTIDTSTGAITTQGIGYAPKLFMRDGVPYVLFLNGVGIRARSLAGTAQIDALHIFPTSGDEPAEVSADGGYLALYDPTMKTYRFFRMNALGNTFDVTELSRYLGVTRAAFSGHGAVLAGPIALKGQTGFALSYMDLAAGTAPVRAFLMLSGVSTPTRLIPAHP